MRMGHYPLIAFVTIVALISFVGRLHAEPSYQLRPIEWRIQPAINPDTPPVASNWATLAGSREDKTAERPTTDWRSVQIANVPAAWKDVDRKKVNDLWYEQTINLASDLSGNRIVLDFWRIEGDAILFFNNQRVGELLRPGGEVDVTRFAQFDGPNTLRIFITRSYTGISRNFEQDPLRFAARNKSIPMDRWSLGITGPVYVHVRPQPVAISDTFVITSWRKKQVTLDVETDATQKGVACQLNAVIRDQDGKDTLKFSSNPLRIAAGRSRQTFSADWANPITWELDRGYLYTAEVSVSVNGKTIHQAPPVKFGFREIWAEGRELLMNGHPSRFRLSMLHGSGVGGVTFLRMIGYNVFQMQPHENNWWRDWNETPLLNEELLSYMDEQGLGATVPAPSINRLRAVLLKDPKCMADYRRETEHWVRRYQNHPSVLCWSVGMNFYNPKDAIHAPTMGQRSPDPQPEQVVLIESAGKVIKSFDPTRLTYSHADGNNADMATANVYLNFIPLQEREDYPSAWAAKGDMPYMAVEFGQPYTANFWKGSQHLMTEYLAMYQGEAAYQREGIAGLKKTLEYGMMNTGHGVIFKTDLNDYPGYWDFQKLFVNNTNRAWRTWGINGGYMNWVIDIGYGDPPGFNKAKYNSVYARYKLLEEPVTSRPEWVNPNFDIHQQANQRLLVYIGGAPVFTDKTHAYFAGEKIQKQIVAVWDGAETRRLDAQWRLVDAAGKVQQTGNVAMTLTAGAILKLPIELTAPPIILRTPMTLELTVRDGPQVVATDSLALQIFPAVPAPTVSGRIALYDPSKQTSPTLKALGINPVAWKPGDSTEGLSLLIIGRDAWKAGDSFGYTPADLARGLHVLVMEQKPEIWEGMGFKTIETMPRYVFARDKKSSVLSGLAAEDLINWRGSPDILPEYKAARSYDVTHGPKWSNRHAAASVVMQIPESAGFTPLLQCEFDLNYSPLLECRYGRGAIWFSSLDFTHRIGADPAATQVLANLLTYAAQPAEPARTTMYAGGPEGKALCARLQLEPGAVSFDKPGGSLLIIGDGSHGLSRTQIDSFVAAGGRILWLSQDAKTLAALGLPTHQAEMWRASADDSPVLRAIGSNLLRWRDKLNCDVFDTSAPGKPLADGLLLLRSAGGQGAELFVQIDPQQLAKRYAGDAKKLESIQLSVFRSHQLLAQLATNMGAGISDDVAARLTHLKAGIAYETLGHWNVLAPFVRPNNEPNIILDKPFPGEESAIAGDTNPNITYTTSEGKPLDWRTTATANDDGFVDLGRAVNRNAAAVGYVTRTVQSDEDRIAVLRLGVDYWYQVWVNGKLVFRVTTGHGSPKANQHAVQIPLKKGENVIALKIVSGDKGFGFWANLSKPGFDVKQSEQDAARDVLYQPLFKNFDPYQFAYW